jgi:hypothetical protein
MIVVTRIPTHRNDGSKVSRRELRGIINKVEDTFQGYSLEGPFQGGWIADDGQRYEEMSYRLEVTTGAERVDEARALFIAIGKQWPTSDLF